MQELRALVSDLAKLEPGPPVVTLLLDIHWRDQHQRDRVRLFFEDRARQVRGKFAGTPDERAMAATLDVLDEWVGRLVNRDAWEDARGAVAVASAPRDLFTELAAPVPYEPALHVADRPVLAPIVEPLGMLRPAILVCVDSRSALLAEWRLGTTSGEVAVSGDVPGHHKRGGWSQLRYSRHIREHTALVWHEAARRLEALAGREPGGALVFFGQEPNARAFRRVLPGWLAARVVAMLPDPHDRTRMLHAAREAMEEDYVEREFALVHRLLHQAQAARAAVLGPQDVLEAVNERRVRMLALTPRFRPRGWVCRKCEALARESAGACPYCGGVLHPASLREELVRRCVRDGIDLRVIRDGGPLDAAHGLAGLLRQLPGEPAQAPGPETAVGAQL